MLQSEGNTSARTFQWEAFHGTAPAGGSSQPTAAYAPQQQTGYLTIDFSDGKSNLLIRPRAQTTQGNGVSNPVILASEDVDGQVLQLQSLRTSGITVSIFAAAVADVDGLTFYVQNYLNAAVPLVMGPALVPGNAPLTVGSIPQGSYRVQLGRDNNGNIEETIAAHLPSSDATNWITKSETAALLAAIDGGLTSTEVTALITAHATLPNVHHTPAGGTAASGVPAAKYSARLTRTGTRDSLLTWDAPTVGLNHRLILNRWIDTGMQLTAGEEYDVQLWGGAYSGINAFINIYPLGRINVDNLLRTGRKILPARRTNAQLTTVPTKQINDWDGINAQWTTFEFPELDSTTFNSNGNSHRVTVAMSYYSPTAGSNTPNTLALAFIDHDAEADGGSLLTRNHIPEHLFARRVG